MDRNDDEPGAGFVTCPLWILAHRGLSDCDKVVLLMLDQIGWREGRRDGVVLASNEEIGRRLGKSAATIKRSLPRLAALEPPLIALDKAASTSRDSIRLLYDRYGKANIADNADYPMEGQICATPALSYQESVPVVGVAYDPDMEGQICTRASAGQICASLPLVERVVVVVEEGGVGEGQICATPAEVDGTGTVGATFPVGPRTLPELISWLRGYVGPEDLGDPDEREARSKLLARLGRDLPLWLPPFLRRFPEHSVGTFCDWVVDALLQATDAEDPLKYARKILREWSKLGGRPGIEIEEPEPEPFPAAELPPIHPMPARNGHHPRPSKAERNAQAAAERNAMFDSMFSPKEARNGSL